MVTEKIMRGGVSLRQIELEDCNPSYVNWLNDPDVNQYMETKWSEQTIESITQFVEKQRDSIDSVLFAIINNETGCHIGNIKIGPVHPHYRHADLSYFIGDKTCWNKGLATEAVRLVCRFGFEELGLHRIEAGVYELAVGSWKVLEKNHFKREGMFREQVYFQGSYINVYRYGLLRNEESDQQQTFNQKEKE